MAEDYFAKLGHFAQSAVARLQVKSALNPILWLCGIAIPGFLGGAWLFRSDPTVCHWLIAFAATPMIVACVIAIGFAIFKPDKLQSEDYQLRHEALQLIEQKGSRFPIPSTSLEAIANPASHLLDTGSSKGK